jgi:hypothetical protein
MNEKQLGKIMPDKKVQIQNYVKEHNTDFRKTDDVVTMVKYVTELQ